MQRARPKRDTRRLAVEFEALSSYKDEVPDTSIVCVQRYTRCAGFVKSRYKINGEAIAGRVHIEFKGTRYHYRSSRASVCIKAKRMTIRVDRTRVRTAGILFRTRRISQECACEWRLVVFRRHNERPKTQSYGLAGIGICIFGRIIRVSHRSMGGYSRDNKQDADKCQEKSPTNVPIQSCTYGTLNEARSDRF